MAPRKRGSGSCPSGQEGEQGNPMRGTTCRPSEGRRRTHTWRQMPRKPRSSPNAFFPPPAQADLSDVPGGGRGHTGPWPLSLYISSDVTEATIAEVIQSLPGRKAPGPDRITNQVLKVCKEEISEYLTVIARACLHIGYHPRAFRHMTTVVLRKDGKDDYSLPGSYRPIALENTLGKVLEKVVADHLSAAVEEHALLPQTQMGARKNHSTITALSLLTETIHTAWKRDSTFIVSMLSLDLSGAFDKVSHDRLLWILQKKRLPEWVIRFVGGFLMDQRTQLVFSDYTSDEVRT